MQLDPDDIEQIAHRVAELVRSGPTDAPSRYVDAAALADELGVDRDWVYAHARQLGAVRLGGPRGRLRFDRQQALATLTAETQPAAVEPLRSSRRRGRPGPRDLIPYEG